MRYQIRVAGKIFEGTDLKILLKRAVEARKATFKPSSQVGSRSRYRSSRAGV